MKQQPWNPDWWYIPIDTFDRMILDCRDLPCVDVGIGIYHHPLCVMGDSDQYASVEDIFGPLTPEQEEMVPPDVKA